MGDGHADGGAAGDGFDHHRQLGLFHELLQVLLRHSDSTPAGGAHLVGYQTLGHILIHSDGRAQASRTGIGNAQQIQGGLDTAVLSACPVEGQIDYVSLGTQLQHALSNGGGAGILPARPHLSQVGSLGADLFKGLGNGGLKGVHRAVGPLHAKEQVHQGHLVFLGAQGLAHHGSGGQGYVALGAQAAGQYHYFHP